MTGSANQQTLLRGADRAAYAAALVQALRRAGVNTSHHATERYATALATTRPLTRTELYWITRVSVVSDVRDLDVFDRVFEVVFEGGALPTGRDARKSQQSPPASEDTHTKLTQRATAPTAVGGVPWTSAPSIADDELAIDAPESEVELPELLPASLAEIAEQPFDQLLESDLVRVGKWLEDTIVSWPTRRVRRTRPTRNGSSLDQRRTLRMAHRTGGDPVKLVQREQLRRPRRVVMIADVSGSMQSFVRPYLHVMRALTLRADAEVYAFSTALTRITPALRSGDPGDAIERASALVDDRFSGTRIASSVFELTSHPTWSTSVRGATVLIASDGWDTDPPEELGQRMARLSRMAHRIVWVNPRAAAEDFQPLVGGMAAALPHCSTMHSGHSLAAMRAVLISLGSSF